MGKLRRVGNFRLEGRFRRALAQQRLARVRLRRHRPTPAARERDRRWFRRRENRGKRRTSRDSAHWWRACPSSWTWVCRCGSFVCGICWRSRPGKVIESQWNHGNDLPLAAGEVTLAWTEFEVIDTQLGVRVTRLP